MIIRHIIGAVRQHLLDDANLQGLVSNRIYCEDSDLPENPAYPYVSLWLKEDGDPSMAGTGADVTGQVVAWSKTSGDEAMRIGELVATRLLERISRKITGGASIAGAFIPMDQTTEVGRNDRMKAYYCQISLEGKFIRRS